MSLAAINPTELVNAATYETMAAPDWATNMQIIDMCNATPALCYPVMEALKKRLQTKKASVGLLAVALLEALMKNCAYIHPFVGNREFMELFVKTLPKKVREPGKSKSFFRRDSITNVVEVERIDRTLLLIQSWAAAFAKITEYPIFTEIHRELQRAGVHFPEAQKDEGAPVFTPPVTATPEKKPPIKASQAAASGSLDAKQSFRDRECQVAAEGANLLNEALTASEEHCNLAKDDLIQALLVNVRSSAGSINSRIQSGTSSELELEELLRVNDILNNSIGYYQGLMNGTMTRAAYRKAQADAKQKSGEKDKKKKKKAKKADDSSSDSEEESSEEEQKQPQSGSTPAAIAPWLAQPVKKKGTETPTKSGSKKKKKKDGAVPKLAPPPAVAGKSKASHLTPDTQSPIIKTASPTPNNAASTPAVDPLDLLFGDLSSKPTSLPQQQPQPQQASHPQPSYTTPFHSSQQAMNPFMQPNPYGQQHPSQQQQQQQQQHPNPFFQSTSQPIVQQPVSYYPGQQQQASMTLMQSQQSTPFGTSPHQPIPFGTSPQQPSPFGVSPHQPLAPIHTTPFGGPDPFSTFTTPTPPTSAPQQTPFGAFGYVTLPNRTPAIPSSQSQPSTSQVDDDPWAALATRDTKPTPTKQQQQQHQPVDELDDFAKLAMR